MDRSTAVKLLQPFFSLLVPEVRRELTVVTPETLGTSYLLHISKDTELKRFVPGVTRRGLSKEDRTVPRICTAPSLIGCILAYSSTLHDFHGRLTGQKFNGTRQVPFKGGYAIYGFPFEVALRPSPKLVPDVRRTDEHWLVAYDSAHADYRATCVGKVFYSEVTYQVVAGEPQHRVEMYIEVIPEEGFWLTAKRKLTSGFWHVTVTDLDKSPRWDQLTDLQVERIDPKHYATMKRNVASLLSLEACTPLTARW